MEKPPFPPTDTEAENEELRRVIPFFSTWKQLYAFVLIELAVLIVLFYLFSRAFA